MKKRLQIFSCEKEYIEFAIRNGAKARLIYIDYEENEILTKGLCQYTIEVLWPNNKWRQVYVSLLFRSRDKLEKALNKKLLTIFLSDIGYIKEVRKTFGPELTNN